MPRIEPRKPEEAQGKAKALLDDVKKALGSIPNIFKEMAVAPPVLQAYLGMHGALSGGKLDAKLRERIAVLSAELNRCDYCLAAHTEIGKSVGLKEAELVESRGASSADAKTKAGLTFARTLIADRGEVADADVAAVREAGYSDAEILEIVGNVALNIFTNYFNHVCDTVVDFPKVDFLK